MVIEIFILFCYLINISLTDIKNIYKKNKSLYVIVLLVVLSGEVLYNSLFLKYIKHEHVFCVMYFKLHVGKLYLATLAICCIRPDKQVNSKLGPSDINLNNVR